MRNADLRGGMTTFYLNRKTGALSAEPGPWTWPLDGYSLRVTRPLLISCRIHNCYEQVGQIESTEVVDRSGSSLMAFARSILAASAPDCTTYRRWKTGLVKNYREVLERAPAIDAPLVSYLGLAETLHTRVPFERGLRNLAGADELRFVLPPTTRGRIPYLHPEDGTVRWHPYERRPADGVPLENSGWLFIRCRTCHRWECVDTLPALSGIVSNVLAQYACVLIGQAVRSCEDYAMRTQVLKLPEAAQVSHPFAWFKACAERIVQATEDVGWVVAQALDRLIDLA